MRVTLLTAGGEAGARLWGLESPLWDLLAELKEREKSTFRFTINASSSFGILDTVSLKNEGLKI